MSLLLVLKGYVGILSPTTKFTETYFCSLPFFKVYTSQLIMLG